MFILIYTIIIFRVWKYTNIIRIFWNLSLQVLFYLILAIFYVSQLYRSTRQIVFINDYIWKQHLYLFSLHSLTNGSHTSSSPSTSSQMGDARGKRTTLSGGSDQPANDQRGPTTLPITSAPSPVRWTCGPAYPCSWASPMAAVVAANSG
jgi:hypothetical protein